MTRFSRFRFRFWLILVPLFINLPACSDTLQIQVEENKDLNTKHYLLTQGDCKILWRLQFFQSGSGFGIREEIHCALPLATQTGLRQSLLQKVSDETHQMQGVRNFVWAKVQNKDVFMPRLAQALANSGEWDAKLGSARGKARNDIHFIRDVMNQKQIFAEMSNAFAAAGWGLTVVDVEKVQIGEMALPTGAGQYPLDCTLVFSIQKKAPHADATHRPNPHSGSHRE